MARFAGQVGVGTVPFGRLDEIVPNLSGFDARSGWLQTLELVDAFLQTIFFENALPSLRAALAGSASDPTASRSRAEARPRRAPSATRRRSTGARTWS
jgi:hypothetical protein